MNRMRAYEICFAAVATFGYVDLTFNLLTFVTSLALPHIAWPGVILDVSFGLTASSVMISAIFLTLTRRRATEGVPRPQRYLSSRSVVFVLRIGFSALALLLIAGLTIASITITSKATLFSVAHLSGRYFEFSRAGRVEVTIDRYLFVLKIKNLWSPVGFSLVAGSITSAMMLHDWTVKLGVKYFTSPTLSALLERNNSGSTRRKNMFERAWPDDPKK
jgi:hypothetical protein